MFIKVDQDRCVGCGRCTEICPGVFRLNENMKSEVIVQDDFECAKRADDECPREAILVDIE
ncbi:MAG: ferredoxin [Patescibacteria group bacterium]|nr:ferredoxin [Patescibacteria group bacterium]